MGVFLRDDIYGPDAPVQTYRYYSDDSLAEGWTILIFLVSIPFYFHVFIAEKVLPVLRVEFSFMYYCLFSRIGRGGFIYIQKKQTDNYRHCRNGYKFPAAFKSADILLHTFNDYGGKF